MINWCKFSDFLAHVCPNEAQLEEITQDLICQLVIDEDDNGEDDTSYSEDTFYSESEACSVLSLNARVSQLCRRNDRWWTWLFIEIDIWQNC